MQTFEKLPNAVPIRNANTGKRMSAEKLIYISVR